jgi:hypothetical protein
MTWMGLGRNYLSGTIPPEISKLTKVHYECLFVDYLSRPVCRCFFSSVASVYLFRPLPLVSYIYAINFNEFVIVIFCLVLNAVGVSFFQRQQFFWDPRS